MQKNQERIANELTGIPLVGAQVTIQNYPGLTSATVYATNALTYPVTQPITVAADGTFPFYAPDGHYQYTINPAGGVPYVLTDILFADPATDLSASSGSSLVGTSQTVPVVVPYLQTVSDILNGERVSLFRFINPTLLPGLISGTDPSTDLTTSVQTAFDAADAGAFDLYLPPVKKWIRLTAPINITHPCTISGGGVTHYVASPNNTQARGSWFYINHTGVGFNVAAAANALMGSVYFEKIGTVRDQPAPAGGWTPNANDFDIKINNTDVHIKKVMLLNPTKGIQLLNGNAGRLDIDGLYGQPLQIGVDIDTSYDTCRMNNIHFWPFWQNDLTNVHNYTYAHLNAIQMERCDNPKINNLFSIYAKNGIVFGYNGSGYTQRAQLSNIDIDVVGVSAIAVLAGADGSSFAVNNLQSYPAGLLNQGIACAANNCFIQANNVHLTLMAFCASTISGSGNVAQYSNWIVDGYNGANNASPCFFTGAGNKTTISGVPKVTATNAAPIISSLTTHDSSFWLDWTPTVTSLTGTITTVGAVIARAQACDGVVRYQANITITTNGTGAGAVRVALPIANTAKIAEGSGRETNNTGKQLSCTIAASASSVLVYNYDNTYPAGDGAVLNISGFYEY